MTRAEEAFQAWFQSIPFAFRPANNIWFGKDAWLAAWRARGEEMHQGSLPPCDECRQPQTTAGVVVLTIGVPDAQGRFVGVKRHRCVRCATAIAQEDAG